MICPNPECERIISSFDVKCSHCGTPLQTNPVKNHERKAGDIVDKAEREAEEFKKQMKDGFKGGNRTILVGPEKPENKQIIVCSRCESHMIPGEKFCPGCGAEAD